MTSPLPRHSLLALRAALIHPPGDVRLTVAPRLNPATRGLPDAAHRQAVAIALPPNNVTIWDDPPVRRGPHGYTSRAGMCLF